MEPHWSLPTRLRTRAASSPNREIFAPQFGRRTATRKVRWVRGGRGFYFRFRKRTMILMSSFAPFEFAARDAVRNGCYMETVAPTHTIRQTSHRHILFYCPRMSDSPDIAT